MIKGENIGLIPIDPSQHPNDPVNPKVKQGSQRQQFYDSYKVTAIWQLKHQNQHIC